MAAGKRQTIMLVDDNQANLTMGKNLLKDHYEVYALPSAERLFKFLESVTPDLILLDIEMPGMSGFEVIKILKADARHADIPVIFVTSKTEEVDELEGLELGAVDYVAKPFSAAILLKRIATHLLIKKQGAELRNFNDNLIEMVKTKAARIAGFHASLIGTIADLVEFRDAFTGGHIARTRKYVRLLVDQLAERGAYSDERLAWEDTDVVVSSTQLHDVGKIFISDVILNKPGKLTPGEFEIMKTHVAMGVVLIRRLEKNTESQPFMRYAETIAGTHHEKWDGSGYPSGLKGRDIPLSGRLMALADVYDALTSARPYKAAFSAEKAEEIITVDSASHFDPVLLDIFRDNKDRFAAIAENSGCDYSADAPSGR